MREVFTDSLPKIKNKKNKNIINWKQSVGYVVEFMYDDLSGQIKILEYINGYLKIEYKNNCIDIMTDSFSKCKIGALVGKINKNYKYHVKQIIENSDSKRMKILELLHRSGKRGYSYECLECGNIDNINEYALINGQWCNACCSAPRKVVRGFNDIISVDPCFGKLLWNYEDGHKYTVGSGQRIDFKCPNCNERIKNKKISSVRNNGLSCPRCSDGKSYPEKLVFNALKQAGITDLESQYSPSWAVVNRHDIEKLNGRKYYDMNSNIYNFTVEVNGGQHSRESSRKGKRARSLAEEQENDKLKEELHFQNSTAQYIKINADRSELEYIKHNLLSSELANILNLQAVDWKKCEADSRKSWVKIASEYFNEGIYTTADISKIMSLSQGTVTRYLKQGATIGWCNYDVKEEKRKSNSKVGIKQRKKVMQLSLSGEFIKEFESLTQVAEMLNLKTGNLSAACKGKKRSLGGFQWVYKDEYEKSNGVIAMPYKRKLTNKPIIMLTFEGKFLCEYDSASEACRILGINYRDISAVCLGKRNSAGGYKWLFKEDFA